MISESHGRVLAVGGDVAAGAFLRLTTILAGLAVIGYSLAYFRPDAVLVSSIIFLGAALLVAESLSVPLTMSGTVGASGAVVLAALFLLPLPAVLVTATLGVVGAIGVREARSGETDLFLTVGKRAVAVFAAGAVFHLSGGELLLRGAGDPSAWLGPNLIGAVLAMATYFVADYVLDQALVAFKERIPLKPGLAGAFTRQSLGWVYLGSLPMGLAGAVAFSLAPVPMNMVATGLLLGTFAVLIKYAGELHASATVGYPGMLRAVTRAIESQDPLYRGHADRVGELAAQTARQIGLYGEELQLIRYAGLLHDIGKLYLEDDGRGRFDLDAQENGGVHALHGAQILGMDPYLRQIAEVVRKHHQPYRLKLRSRDNLPIGSRIIKVVACFDELTHVGPEEARLTTKKALRRLSEEQGATYDPQVLKAFEQVLRNRDLLF